MNKPLIHISDYNYPLPDERIAKFPLEQRDASKLLVYRKGETSETVFSDLPSQLEPHSLLVFNNTKVIQARLRFRRESGALVEIFCLDPHLPKDYSLVFSGKKTCEWNCIVGNLKKWKEEALVLPFSVEGETVLLKATKLQVSQNAVRIRFDWDADICFAQVLECCGAIPIPPYLHRESEPIDEIRYQTVYSKFLGSVAAPTAGLHFTENVFNDLKNKSITIAELTLHVGAGTFKPVKSATIDEHEMHAETFRVKIEFLKQLIEQVQHGHPVVAVGTTSVRTLESLYWLGWLCKTQADSFRSHVPQWLPYENSVSLSSLDALTALITYMEAEHLDVLDAATQIIIAPSYQFRIVQQIITNFHQPQSTLLLLISALIGDDWKKVYHYALTHDFRFLSYGDSSLLIP